MKNTTNYFMRFISTLLSICICLTLFPVEAYAAKYPASARYTVLVLDTSSDTPFYQDEDLIFTAQTAIEQVKEGALKFIADIKNTAGKNYVAVVEYKGKGANIVQGFTSDTDLLSEKINSLYSSGENRSIAEGLDAAYDLLKPIKNLNAIKNVVLFSTGLTDIGPYEETGKYNKSSPGSDWFNENTDIYLYQYANAAIESANKIKEKTGANIYSIGLFQSYDKIPVIASGLINFLKMSSFDCSSGDGYNFEVSDVKEIQFVFDKISDDILQPTISGNFRYPSKNKDGEVKDFEAPYKYSDNYFVNSAYEYNNDLALMSMCLAWSAFGSNETRTAEDLALYGPDYTKYSQNVEQLLNEIGFSNITPNEYYNVKPEIDSIGAIAGHKIISDGEKDYTLIALAVRGGGYESEWGSNVTLGKSGQHQGFEEARDNVLKFLKKYIKTNKISGEIKLWITGYSRAAATSNLTAGELDKNSRKHLGWNISLEPSNIYAYCFETPQGTLTDLDGKDKVYDNIFNIINPVDIVTKVAMEHFNFTHYGERVYIPSSESDVDYVVKRNKMLEIYKTFDIKDYRIDNFFALSLDSSHLGPETIFDVEDISMRQFLESLLNTVSLDVLKSRENYVESFQDSMREICYIFFGSISSDPQKLNTFTDILETKMIKNVFHISSNIATNDYSSLTDLLKDIVFEVLVESGITNVNEEDINKLVSDLSQLLLKIIPHWQQIATLIWNAGIIVDAHLPELCYSWLASGVYLETNGDYRVIHINCPVDVSVYDSNNTLVSKIKDNIPVDLKNGYSYAYINNDGAKEIVLPVNESYTVELKATDVGEVNVSVKEFSAEIGDYASLNNYYDVPINKGDILSLNIPEIPQDALIESTANGTNTQYMFFDINNKEISPSITLKGDDVRNSYYYVNVVKNIEEAGAVIGAGSKMLGEYTKLKAITSEDYEFVGWYENNNLLSAEQEFRFRVEEDKTIEARFNKYGSPYEDTSISDEPSDVTLNTNQVPVLLIIFTVLCVIAIALLWQYNKKKKRNTK